MNEQWPDQQFEPEAPKRTVDVVLRCKHAGFAFDLNANLLVDEIPGLIRKLQATGIEPGNSPYLWDGQGKPPQTAAAPPAQATSQPQRPAAPPQASGGGSEQPSGWTQAGNPICPRHNSEMRVSKYGGWYCGEKTDNPAWANPKGYCTYQYKE